MSWIPLLTNVSGSPGSRNRATIDLNGSRGMLMRVSVTAASGTAQIVPRIEFLETDGTPFSPYQSICSFQETPAGVTGHYWYAAGLWGDGPSLLAAAGTGFDGSQYHGPVPEVFGYIDDGIGATGSITYSVLYHRIRG